MNKFINSSKFGAELLFISNVALGDSGSGAAAIGALADELSALLSC